MLQLAGELKGSRGEGGIVQSGKSANVGLAENHHPFCSINTKIPTWQLCLLTKCKQLPTCWSAHFHFYVIVFPWMSFLTIDRPIGLHWWGNFDTSYAFDVCYEYITFVYNLPSLRGKFGPCVILGELVLPSLAHTPRQLWILCSQWIPGQPVKSLASTNMAS